MLAPLSQYIGEIPFNLLNAIRKTGKRGDGTYYPGDLARVELQLETISDLTGHAYVYAVIDGNVERGMEWLRSRLMEEEHLIEMEGVYALTKW